MLNLRSVRRKTSASMVAPDGSVNHPLSSAARREAGSTAASSRRVTCTSAETTRPSGTTSPISSSSSTSGSASSSSSCNTSVRCRFFPGHPPFKGTCTPGRLCTRDTHFLSGRPKPSDVLLRAKNRPTLTRNTGSDGNVVLGERTSLQKHLQIYKTVEHFKRVHRCTYASRCGKKSHLRRLT